MEVQKKLKLKVNIGGASQYNGSSHVIQGNLVFSTDYSTNHTVNSIAQLHIFIPAISQSPSSIQNLVKFLEKLFNKDKRLVTLPELFYFGLNEKHFSVNISSSFNDVVIQVYPGNKLQATLEELVSSLKSHEIQKVIKQDKTSIEFTVHTNSGVDERLKQYCLHSGEMPLSYFLLDKLCVNFKTDIEQEAGDAVDKLLSKVFPDANIGHLSLFETCDMELDVHLPGDGENAILWNNKEFSKTLQDYFQYLIDIAIGYFRGLSDNDLKNWAKMLKFLKQETSFVEAIYAEFLIKDIGWFECEVLVTGVLDLLELLMFHPLASHKEKIQLFKSKFLQKDQHSK